MSPTPRGSHGSDTDQDGFTLVRNRKQRTKIEKPPRRRTHRGGMKQRERRARRGSTTDPDDMDVEMVMAGLSSRNRNLAPLLEVAPPSHPSALPAPQATVLPPLPLTCRPGFISIHISSLLPEPLPPPTSPPEDSSAPVIHLDTEDEEVLAIMVDMDLDIRPESRKILQPPHHDETVASTSEEQPVAPTTTESDTVFGVQSRPQDRPSLRTVMQGQAWLANVGAAGGASLHSSSIMEAQQAPLPVRHVVPLEPADRTLALLGMPVPAQGRIFFNPASDEEKEELVEAEDAFQDAEATQFSPTRTRNDPTLVPGLSQLPLQLATSSPFSTPPPTRKTSEDYDNERAARHIRMMTDERPRHSQISSSSPGSDSLRTAKASARNRGNPSPSQISASASPCYDVWGIRRRHDSPSAEGAAKPSTPTTL